MNSPITSSTSLLSAIYCSRRIFSLLNVFVRGASVACGLVYLSHLLADRLLCHQKTIDGKLSSVELGIIPFLRTHLVFPCQPSECLAIHSAACCSVAKPLTTSVGHSGQRTSTSQIRDYLFAPRKRVGIRTSLGICAYGATVQAGRLPPSTPPNLRSTAILHLRKPLVRAWLLRVRWYSRRQLPLLDLARAPGGDLMA